jgi:hypothetical protein
MALVWEVRVLTLALVRQVFCLRTFPPSDDFTPYLEVYLFQASSGAGIRGDDKQAVMGIAQSAVRKLAQRLEEGPVDAVITKEEIEAQRGQMEIMATCYFADHSIKKFAIDEEVTVQQLKDMIAVALKIRLVDTYGLYDVSNIAGDLTGAHRLS